MIICTKKITFKMNSNLMYYLSVLFNNRHVLWIFTGDCFKLGLWIKKCRYSSCMSIVARVVVEGDTVEMTQDLIRSKIHRKLYDFDNHLDDITFDWKNVILNDLISEHSNNIDWCNAHSHKSIHITACFRLYRLSSGK